MEEQKKKETHMATAKAAEAATKWEKNPELQEYTRITSIENVEEALARHIQEHEKMSGILHAPDSSDELFIE